MKRTVILSLGMLLSFALIAGAYAGQGQTGFGGASGEASPEPDMKSPPPAKTPRASTAPKASQSDMKAGSAAQSITAPSVKAATSGRTATIEGEVLRIKGNSYTVKDTSGKTVRLRVDKDTKLDSNISQHDMVIANASEMTIGKSSASPKTVWHADSMSKQ